MRRLGILCGFAVLALAGPGQAAEPKERSGEQVVAMRCVQCHGTGVGGAPKIGDRAAWIDRARNGIDTLVRSAIKGHGQMPARGGMADLTDPEMHAAVSHMIEVSLRPSK